MNGEGNEQSSMRLLESESDTGNSLLGEGVKTILKAQPLNPFATLHFSVMPRHPALEVKGE